MERLTLPNGSLIAWQSAGDGFPLLLLPGPRGAAPWLPHMPLLGELCQTIAYEGFKETPKGQSAVDLLPAVLDRLRLQRVYLASPVSEWPATLAFAARRPERLEAVLFVEFPGAEDAAPPDACPSLPRAEVSLPALVLLAGENSPCGAAADRLAAHLPDCRRAVLGGPPQPAAGLPSAPKRQFAHLMMQFLLDRERHRNLVRGASFLL